MSINLHKILTVTMATGMLLSAAGGVSSAVQHSALVTASASRRYHRHYRRRSYRPRKRARRTYRRHATRRRRAKKAPRRIRRASHKRARRARRRAARKPKRKTVRRRVIRVRKGILSNAAIWSMKRNDSFVILKVASLNKHHSMDSVYYDAKKLSRAGITYGIAVDDTIRPYNAGKEADLLAPGAAFRVIVQPHAHDNVNYKAQQAAKGIRDEEAFRHIRKVPTALYTGSLQGSRALSDSTRDAYTYNWMSYKDHTQNVWRFPKSYYNDRIAKIMAKPYLMRSTMPIEFGISAHHVVPTDQAIRDAISYAMSGQTNSADRAAESGAMQQWQHKYDMHIMQGPHRNVNTVRHVLKTPQSTLQRRASHHFKRNRRMIMLGASNGKKASGVRDGIYTTGQMQNAYTSMQQYRNRGYNGAHVPEACEATSMDMGMHLLGIDGRNEPHAITLMGLLRSMPYNGKYGKPSAQYNPEYGYTWAPWKGRGPYGSTAVYPQALVKAARAHGARKSYILADNAYWSSSSKGNRYLADTHIGRSYGMKRYTGSLKKLDNKKLFLHELGKGHPIVVEADHDFSGHGDHVVLLWGYKKGRFYWADSNDNPHHILIGHSISWNNLESQMDAANRGPRAVVIAK